MQQKLAGYRRPAPPLPREAAERMAAARRAAIPPKPLFLRRWAAAAVALLLLGTATYVAQRLLPTVPPAATAHHPVPPSPATPAAVAPIAASIAAGHEAALPIRPRRRPVERRAADLLPPVADSDTSAIAVPTASVPPRHSSVEQPTSVAATEQRHTAPGAPADRLPQKRSSARLAATVFFANAPAGSPTARAQAPMLAAAQPFGPYDTALRQPDGEALRNQSAEQKDEVHHRQPVRFGLSLHYAIDRRWSLSAALTYTRLVSDLTRTSNHYSYLTEQKLIYLGLPLSVHYRLLETPRFTFYLSAGGTVEKMIDGSATTQTVFDNALQAVHTEAVRIRPLQFSVETAAGIEYRFVPRFGCYVEPGVSYHFRNSSRVPTLYRDRPFNFQLNLGFRFRFKP